MQNKKPTRKSKIAIMLFISIAVIIIALPGPQTEVFATTHYFSGSSADVEITVNSAWSNANKTINIYVYQKAPLAQAFAFWRIRDTGGNIIQSGDTYSGPRQHDNYFTVTATQRGTVEAGVIVMSSPSQNYTSPQVAINIDKTAPTVAYRNSGDTANFTSSSWGNTDVTVRLKPADTGGSGFYRIRTAWTTSSTAPSTGWSSWTTSTNFTRTQSGNGQWYLHTQVQDNAGNQRNTTNGPYRIDKIAPSLDLSQTPTSWTNQDVTIVAAASSTSGISLRKWAAGSRSVSYFSSSGTVLSGSSFNVSDNGTYTVFAKDEAGNESVQTIEVSNIDETVPVITLTPSTTAPTNQDVTINVSITDAGSGVSVRKYAPGSQSIAYFATNGTTLSGTTITATENGAWTVYAKDNAGNEAVQTITISNIDKTPPEAPTFSDLVPEADGSGLLTISYSADSEVKLYKIDSGPWSSYDSPILINPNATVYAKAEDAAGNVSEEAVYNYTGITYALGNNAYGVLEFSTNTLTISGTGATSDFDTDHSPLHGNTVIEKVVISSDITALGSYVFSDCINVEEIHWLYPDNALIGTGALSGMGSNVTPKFAYAYGSNTNFISAATDAGYQVILSYQLGANVTGILNTSTGVLTVTGTGPMYDFQPWGVSSPLDSNTDIELIVIEDGVTSIGSYAFNNCTNLASVAMAPSILTISGSAFLDCSSLESVSLSSGLTEIGHAAFQNCGLESIAIPDSVVYIDSSAFYSNQNLTHVTLPSTLTSLSPSIFHGCTSLERITIPDSVTSIGMYAFFNCHSLEEIVYMYEGNTTLDLYAFLNAGRDVSPKYAYADPANTNFINAATAAGYQVISSYQLGADVFGELDTSTGVLTVTGTGPMYNFSSSNSPVYNNTDIISVIVEEGVTSIGAYVFQNCTNIASVDLPDTLTSIGNHSFAYCTSLESITIPASVTSIDQAALAYNTNLNEIINHSIINQSIGESILYGSGTGTEKHAHVYFANSNFVFEAENAGYTINYLDMISVTHPLVVGWAIVPDNETAFEAADIALTNYSATSIQVEVTNVSSLPESTIAPTLVAPTAYANWDTLTRAQTESAISLSLVAGASNGWAQVNSEVTSLAGISSPVLIGQIASAGTAILSLDARHGLAWAESQTINYKIEFLFSVAGQ